MSPREQESGSILLRSQTTKDRNYYCAHCGVVITTESARIVRDGSREHTFSNPAGRVFTIGLFRQAEGCLEIGEPTVELSWFPGFAWDYVVCAGCTSHLGWRYTAAGEEFFGLILAELICP